MEKIENIKRPVKKGERFLVPCIVEKVPYNGVYIRMDSYGEYEVPVYERVYITPVINHPHNDVENGQMEIHYHTDYRFVRFKMLDGGHISVINRHSYHYFAPNSRPKTPENTTIQYIDLPVINEDFYNITASELISKSKLKHKCIHKGKCPHRGMDLSQVGAKNGVIKCPLHGLEFDEKTGKLLSLPKQQAIN